MSEPLPFEPDADSISVHALLIAERIDTRSLEKRTALSVLPLTIHAGASGLAVLFRYGAVVMFNMSEEEERAFLDGLRPLIHEPIERPEEDVARVAKRPHREEQVDPSGTVLLKDWSLEKLQLVADILAKNVVLAHDEERIRHVFDRIEPLAAHLKQAGRARRDTRALLRQIGDVLLTQHRMVGRVEITERPELLWDYPQLERLYLRLEDEYELRERDRALDRKLDLISRTVETLLDLVHNKRSLRVEWYIVILIVVEIVLYLYDMFIRGVGHA